MDKAIAIQYYKKFKTNIDAKCLEYSCTKNRQVSSVKFLNF
jgi:hypothetical protein